MRSFSERATFLAQMVKETSMNDLACANGGDSASNGENDFSTLITVQSFDELQALAGKMATDYYQANAENVANGIKVIEELSISAKIMKLLRGEPVVFSKTEQNDVSHAFPMTVQVVSNNNLVVDTERLLNDDDPSHQYGMYNYGTVTITKSGCLHIKGYIQSLTIDELNINGGNTLSIIVEGEDGKAGSGGASYRKAPDGQPGYPGSGPKEEKRGGDGSPGHNGDGGQSGYSGTASPAVNIDIKQLEGTCYILSKTGKGGTGGNGGSGGVGGDGGQGGEGLHDGSYTSNGGDGGRGGDGGHGGNGGDGGAGADSSSNTISIKLRGDNERIKASFAPLAQATGGSGGVGGSAGIGGAGGKGCCHNGNRGADGQSGKSGYSGKLGAQGKNAPIKIEVY